VYALEDLGTAIELPRSIEQSAMNVGEKEFASG
jgi:hypothetical protein